MGTSADQRYAAEAENQIDWLLALLEFPKKGIKRVGRGTKNLSLGDFCPSLVPAAFDLDPDPLICTQTSAIAELWPIHTKVCFVPPDTAGTGALYRLDTVSPKQASGFVNRIMPRMLRWAGVRIGGNQSASAMFSRYYGLDTNGELVPITNGEKPVLKPSEDETMRLLAGLQLNMEYAWQVRIRRNGYPLSLSFPTNPRGARKLLSLRDIPEGKQRRMALRHWVSEHTRRLPDTNDETDRETLVSQHLRGKIPFSWNDFQGEVIPAPYDLRQAENRR